MYVCIELHDNNFRPVVLPWKSFHSCFVHLRRRWNSTASIINGFTTFLLLTLYPSHCCTVSLGKSVLYYDPKVDHHTWEFAMFASIAVCVLLVFILISTILLFLYLTRLYRKCVPLWILGVAYFAHLWNHCRDSTRIDGSNNVTLCLQNGFRIFLHSKGMNYCYIPKSYYYSWSSSYQFFFLFNSFLYVWCYKVAIQIKVLSVAMHGVTYNNVDILILFWFGCHHA